jgi:endonuclease YncB( thermonuclease family)
MDEFNHPHFRKRRRRVGITVTSALIVLVATLVTRTHPDKVIDTTVKTVQGTVQSAETSVQETVGNTAQTVLEAQPGLWHVSHVVDGDTIDVTMGSQKETVRFLGIDTPETHDPRKPVQCFGLAAAAHTKALLEGKNVRLEPDPTDSDRDKYHRLLRYVYLPDGTLVNAELIHDGYAFAYTVFPLVKLDDFRALEADARDHNRGLWGGCHVDSTQKIEQTTTTK